MKPSEAFTVKSTKVCVCDAAHPGALSASDGVALDFAKHEEVQTFDLVARPRCAAQEFQAGADAGLVCETADRNQAAQRLPTVMVSQLGDDHLQRQAMQGVARLGSFVGCVRGVTGDAACASEKGFVCVESTEAHEYAASWICRVQLILVFMDPMPLQDFMKCIATVAKVCQ